MPDARYSLVKLISLLPEPRKSFCFNSLIFKTYSLDRCVRYQEIYGQAPNMKQGESFLVRSTLSYYRRINELESGEEVQALSRNQIRLLAQTSTPAQQLQNNEGRRVVLYLKPETMFSSAMTRYNQTTNFAEAISKFWPTTQHQDLPLSNAKILKVLHCRNERKTTNKAASSATMSTVHRFNSPRRSFQL